MFKPQYYSNPGTPPSPFISGAGTAVATRLTLYTINWPGATGCLAYVVIVAQALDQEELIIFIHYRHYHLCKLSGS